MRRLTLGVMGHVDHGKTALVRALTGLDTDRLPEEKARGISIALGFAHATFEDVDVDLIDMPGHERFVRTLIAGATGVDAALLAVAANEGIKPQTLEHLEIAAQLGLSRVLVVVTKADLVTPDAAQQVAAATANAVSQAGLQPLGATPVSTVDDRGMAALRQAIVALAGSAAPAPDDGFAWLPIDRAFSVAGHGAVVTGALRHGPLTAETPLTLDGLTVRVRGLQVHGRPVSQALPGQRVAVNLRGVAATSIARGAALATPGVLTPARWLSVALRAAGDGPELANGARLRLLFGTAEVDARLRLLDRDVLAPGEAALAQLDTATPVAVPGRERFVLRLPSPARTVGGGRVLDPASRRLRRHDPAVLSALSELEGAAPADIAARSLRRASEAGVALSRLSQLAGVSAMRAGSLADQSGALVTADLAVMTDVLSAVQTRLRAAVAAQAEVQPNGVPRRRLAGLLPGVGEAVLALALDRALKSGDLQADGAAIRLPPRRAEADARASQAAQLAAGMLARLRDAGLTPPDVPVLAPTPLARRILEQLARDGRAVHTLDRVQKRELYFHPDAVADAKARLRPGLAPPGLTTGEVGALLGVSRKFSVPLLEYLDVIRFTRRLGNRRTLGPAANP
jgi:selenocysteine-specific elongation factor